MSDIQSTAGSNPMALERTPEQVRSASSVSAKGGGSEAIAGKGVEFALVLARMVDSVQNDPEQMRAAIYELARHKLDEQLAAEHPNDVKHIKSSLEIAIRGVEVFFRDDKNRLLSLQSAGGSALPSIASANITEASQRHSIEAAANGVERRQGAIWKKSPAIVLTLLLFLFGLLAFHTRPDLWVFGKKVKPQTAALSPQTPKPQRTEPPRPPVRDPLLPTSYGVYAIGGGKLVALKLFPIPAPDIRIAISAAIETTSQSVLPSGKVRFVVYRRERAAASAERAEVRIVASIIGTNLYDRGNSEVADHEKWVIRNVSFPYRIAPLKDHPEMDEITSDAELAPGRYALILNKEAYDFTVEGPLTDPRHCLERITAANGTFYSQCNPRSMVKQ